MGPKALLISRQSECKCEINFALQNGMQSIFQSKIASKHLVLNWTLRY